MKLINLMPCPWIGGAHAKILPCLARSNSLVIKESSMSKKGTKKPLSFTPLSPYINARYKIGSSATCKLFLGNWKLKFLLSSPFCPRCECVCAGACVFLCTVCLYVQVHSPTQVLGKTTGWHRLSPSVTLYLVFLRQGLPGVSCFGQQLLGPACLCLSQHRNVKPKVPFSDFKCTLGTWGTQACRASIFSHRTISLAF